MLVRLLYIAGISLCLFGLIPKETRDKITETVNNKFAPTDLGEPNRPISRVPDQVPSEIEEFDALFEEESASSGQPRPVPKLANISSAALAVMPIKGQNKVAVVDRRGYILTYSNNGKHQGTKRPSNRLRANEALLSADGAVAMIQTGLNTALFKATQNNSRYRRAPLGFGRMTTLDPSGNTMLNTARGKLISVRELNGKKRRWTLTSITGNVTAMALSDVTNPSAYIVVGTNKGEILGWRYGEKQQAFKFQQPESIRWLHITPDSQKVYALQGFRTVVSRSLTATGIDSETRELNLGTGYAKALHLNADQSLFFAGYRNGKVHVWDMATRKQVATLNAGTSAIASISSSSDNKTVIVNTQSHRATSWNVSALLK